MSNEVLYVYTALLCRMLMSKFITLYHPSLLSFEVVVSKLSIPNPNPVVLVQYKYIINPLRSHLSCFLNTKNTTTDMGIKNPIVLIPSICVMLCYL